METVQGDTIFALASARGKAGVAVFRISGTASHDVVQRLCGDIPQTRRASLRRLTFEGELIDEALILVFDEGASFTGEAAVEIHVHGSAAVIRRMEDILSTFPSCRTADPGEFTRRAMDNGRLDLTQVEGLADLIEAETEAQRQQAQRAFRGELGKKVDRWRADLIHASGLIEAGIDFADEDLPSGMIHETRGLLEGLLVDWDAEIRGARVSERIRDGFEVAIVGAPNSGKSTLINALAKREVAITSSIPGTTRDIIELRTDLGGLPVTFLDTAGVRETSDDVERLGVEKTKKRASTADLRIFLDDATTTLGFPIETGDLVVHGKCDLSRGKGLNVSGKTGEGVDDLLVAIEKELSHRAVGGGAATRVRHRTTLIEASGFVRVALGKLDIGPLEVIADDLRAARIALDVLVGRVDVEDILGDIFSSFCIGK